MHLFLFYGEHFYGFSELDFIQIKIGKNGNIGME